MLDEIFKAYDIRGKSPGQLDPDVARRIGAAFARFAGVERIAVGRDCRASSPGLAAALIEGATSQGASVDDLGLVATDMVYFHTGAAGVPGAMVTASHNPKEWNGIKLALAGAKPVGAESGLADIKAMTAAGLAAADQRGTVTTVDIRRPYIEHLLGIVSPDQFAELQVAADAGNGMAGVVLADVFARLPVDLTGLYLEPDGDFPNHHPDPLRPENLEDLLELMRQRPFHLGVAFDGDADRAFFIDDELRPLPGSTTTAIIARWFLSQEPGATIVHNLICSRAVPETVRSLGGEPVRTRVGHSFIKGVMAETGAVFGGEHSGHYYFRDNFRADSGMLAMLVLLQVMSEDGRPLSEIRGEVEPYAQSGEINYEVEDKEGAMRRVADTLDGDADWLDGLTMQWPDRWFNLRPSNTEPVLRLNVEAPGAADVDELVGTVAAMLT